jgi:hypothetical protein
MERGVKGMPPLDCLPLWGREGVTLIAFFKRMECDRSSPEPNYHYLGEFPASGPLQRHGGAAGFFRQI